MEELSFTPGQDDIEAYIRDIKEAAHQLNYNDEAMLHLIKATMPAEIYGTLYNQNDLNVVITMVKDIYAKKPESTNHSGATGGSSAPFTLMKAPNGTSKRVHFQADESLSDRIDRLTDTLYRMDMDGKSVRKPYKPYITSPRRRGRRGFSRSRGGRSGGDRGDGWPKGKNKFRGGKGGFSKRGRFQGKKFDKSPTTKRSRRFYDINTPTMTNISMDIKHMPPSKSPYKYILVLLCDISNFLVATPMKKATAEEVCSILFDNFMAYYAVPMRIICDQDPAFMSSLCQWFFKAYGIQLVTVSPTNHKSLQAEHGIKSLSNILMKHLSGLGDNWHLYTRPAMLTYNTYNTPNLDNLSPFELALGRKPILVPKLECTSHIPVTGTLAKAKQNLEQKLKYLREKLQKFRDNRLALQNKDKEFHGFTVGQIVYMYHPRGSLLQTSSKKIKCEFVGPLAIYKCVSPNQFLLMSLDGYLYPFLVEETRIKPGYIPTTRGNVSHLAELKKIIRSRLLLPGV